MVNHNLHQPYEVILKEDITHCSRPEHTHSYFELVYIVSGKGRQYINNNRFEYYQGHIFLITPQDSHHFDIESPTKFLFIRFNEIYLKENQAPPEMRKRMDFILNNASHQPGCILKVNTDKAPIDTIIQSIISETETPGILSDFLISQYINTLLVIVARNIASGLPDKVEENANAKALEILRYIQQNILKPEKLKAAEISRHFGISENYLGRFIKKQTGETMQQYIANYKMSLIENRLIHSDMRIIELAGEFGFSDESHFIKTFKKNTGMNPTAFRKQKKQELAEAYKSAV
jgi:AraC-like DNA-binding protein